MQPHSLYLHIPFCQKRCSYCDFNTFAGIGHLIPAYVDALCEEIGLMRAYFGDTVPVHTIFFGGGTPSLLSAAQFEQIFDRITQSFAVQPQAEISIEANPGTVTQDYLHALHNIGVNRLSFGVQTLQKQHYELMGRIHDFEDAIQAVKFARKAGFDNLNLDLIYGLPDQTLDEWQLTLERILDFHPEHISLYALGIEVDTPLYDWVQRGLVNEPDDDLAAEMYDFTRERLDLARFEHYEISNFAKKDKAKDYRCLHNLQYWRNLPYIGLGAGAHGLVNGKRIENVLGVGEYIRRMKAKTAFEITPAVSEITEIDLYRAMQESMMVGLRLIEEGVPYARFEARFGQRLLDVFQDEIKKLQSAGLLVVEADSVALSEKGRLLGNLVFREFV